MAASSATDVCPTCKGNRYILYHVDARELEYCYGGEDISNEHAKPCPDCAGGRRTEDHSRVPEPFREADIYKFDFSVYSKDMGKAKKIVFNFFNEFPEWKKKGKGLYIWSKEPGSGKTFLACCVAKSTMMKHNISMKFVPATEYLQAVSDTMDNSKRGGLYEDYTKPYMDCDLLILDDIGAHKQSEWSDKEIFRLVNNRINEEKITIYTSNMPIEKLNVDERAKSRITAKAVSIHMPEESIRQKKADEDNEDFLRSVLGE